jgi:hypothetical protein
LNLEAIISTDANAEYETALEAVQAFALVVNELIDLMRPIVADWNDRIAAAELPDEVYEIVLQGPGGQLYDVLRDLADRLDPQHWQTRSN